MDFDDYLTLCEYDYDVSRLRNKPMQYHLLVQTERDDAVFSCDSVSDLAREYVKVSGDAAVIQTHVFYGYALSGQLTHKTDVEFSDETQTFIVSYELNDESQ